MIPRFPLSVVTLGQGTPLARIPTCNILKSQTQRDGTAAVRTHSRAVPALDLRRGAYRVYRLLSALAALGYVK